MSRHSCQIKDCNNWFYLDNDEETGTKSRLFQQNKSGVARNKHTVYNNEPKVKYVKRSGQK